MINSITFSSSLNLCWSSTTIPVLLSEESPLDSGPITKEETSWVVALSCLGSLFSTPIYFFLVHNYNRKFIGYLVTVPFIIGWIIIIISKSVTLLYIARFIGGMGNGAALVFPPVYISEIAEDSIRGALGSFLMLFLNIGILFGYIIGAYVNYYTYAYIGILFPLLFIFCYYWLPETPMYLIKIGESNKAKRSLSYLRGKNEEVVQREFSKMSNFLKDREEEPESKTFKVPETKNRSYESILMELHRFKNDKITGGSNNEAQTR
ncbi:Facilitated trehalose transporter Tret1 [Blattella germanica]|nr:Facilitated trehalose transporter Tret1 [Blattella germanica]